MKIEIKSRFSGSVLFSHEAENNTLRLTLEAAIKARVNLEGAYMAGANLARAYLEGAYLEGAYLDGANLGGAYLTGAYLEGAYLAGAYLAGAYLAGANLTGANLTGANLTGADLAGANLTGADLAGAYLAGANLARAYLAGAKIKDDCTLVGERPIFQIGPIGSRCAYFAAYITDKGLRFDAGCQRQITREIFELRLANQHGENKHAREYRAALVMSDLHAELWGSKEDEK